MQTQKISSRTISITLLLSLLFHCSLLFFLLVNHSQKQKKHFLTQKTNTIQWASRKTKTGAPIFFMPTPKQKNQQKNTTQSNTLLKQSMPNLASIQQPPTVTQKKLLQQTQSVINRIKTKKKSSLLKNKVSINKEPERQLLQQKKQDQLTLSQKTHAPQAKPNLLQIAHGFFDHMRKNGKSRVNIIGNEKAKATEQQLREERYLERLNVCIHNAYSIHRQQAPYLGREKRSLQIRVSLNKLGNLLDLQLLDSCGNRHVDQFIIFLFRDAASSFPPLPSYVQHDPYILNYKIFVSNQTANPIQALFN
jgi:hypothetical protein